MFDDGFDGTTNPGGLTPLTPENSIDDVRERGLAAEFYAAGMPGTEERLYCTSCGRERFGICEDCYFTAPTEEIWSTPAPRAYVRDLDDGVGLPVTVAGVRRFA